MSRRLVALGVLAAAMAEPAAARPTERQVKAAFLSNVANFVEWPAEALGAPDAPLRVCVVGTDPLGDALDDAIRNQLVQGRRVEVERGQTLAALGRCHILFLPQTEHARWVGLVKELRHAPTLTVADGPPIVQHGVMVNFVVDARRVRFEIDRNAAEQAGLRISSKLLSLARSIGP